MKNFKIKQKIRIVTFGKTEITFHRGDLDSRVELCTDICPFSNSCDIMKSPMNSEESFENFCCNNFPEYYPIKIEEIKKEY